MREAFRKLVIKEGGLFFIVLSLVFLCVKQNAWVKNYLEGGQTYISKEAPLSQNLAVIGLDARETQAILLLEKFKKDFPRFASLSYSETVGSYLAQYPNTLDNDGLYNSVATAQMKIDRAKDKLSKQGLLERFSNFLKAFGLFMLVIYPVYVGTKYAWRARMAKQGGHMAPIN